MQKKLIPHSLIEDIVITSTLDLKADSLKLSFLLEGALVNYAFSSSQMPKRANELWKATCFELFLANSKKDEYYEFNISPSLAWNLYHLSTYRAEPKEVELLVEPVIKITKENGCYRVDFELKGFALSSFDRVNLTAILLTKEGERTFWSLKKMQGSPDFHERGYFISLSLVPIRPGWERIREQQ